MNYSAQPQESHAEFASEAPLVLAEAAPTVDSESAALQPLVIRTCLALQAMARSLEALERVFAQMEALEPKADRHSELVLDTQETLANVIALLRREGPPLLFRAQALRLRLRLNGHAAGSSAAIVLRTLHADLDGLASFKPERPGRAAAHWVPYVRRARSNTLVILSEFDRHARQIAAQLNGTPPPAQPPVLAKLPSSG